MKKSTPSIDPVIAKPIDSLTSHLILSDMKNITPGRIEFHASKPGVNRIAVENFLSTMGDVERTTVDGIMGNLQMDSMFYHWNRETAQAIQAGIQESLTKNTVD